MLKCGWVDETAEERYAFFAEVEYTVAGTNDAAARRTGIDILEVNDCHRLTLQTSWAYCTCQNRAFVYNRGCTPSSC